MAIFQIKAIIIKETAAGMGADLKNREIIKNTVPVAGKIQRILV
jgi:hypothetical protein